MSVPAITTAIHVLVDGRVLCGAHGNVRTVPPHRAVFPEAVTMMRSWKAGGGRVVGVTNQGGVALGIVALSAVRDALVETQRQADGLFDRIMMCIHHPAAQNPEFSRCWCRKPAPGLLIEAALDLAAQFHEMYPPHMALMVGDRDEDRLCAERASIDFEWAAGWRARA